MPDMTGIRGRWQRPRPNGQNYDTPRWKDVGPLIPGPGEEFVRRATEKASGLAVVLASLYPGITVLLARVLLGERLRWVQRAGLGLAAVGVLLVAA